MSNRLEDRTPYIFDSKMMEAYQRAFDLTNQYNHVANMSYLVRKQNVLRRISFTFFVLLLGLGWLQAQTIDTITVRSRSMNKDIKNTVILPAGYNGMNDLPVVYLLHGYSEDYKAWLKINPELPELATRYELIIVCPDGEASWYLDSPINPESKFETYVAEELVEYIDNHYKTRRENKGRAITGFSMGGYGAMWLAIHHQNVFGACGATSGGVDICPFPDKWEIKKVLGAYKENSDLWKEHCIINQLHLIGAGLSIILDCGTEDFFYSANERLHQEMVNRNIKHDYIARPGIHNNDYWSNSIGFQLLFFSDYFRGKHVYERQLIYNRLLSVPDNL